MKVYLSSAIVVERRDWHQADCARVDRCCSDVMPSWLAVVEHHGRRPTPIERQPSDSRTVGRPEQGPDDVGAGADSPSGPASGRSPRSGARCPISLATSSEAAHAEERVGGEAHDVATVPASSLPCSRLFIADQPSAKLPKKLLDRRCGSSCRHHRLRSPWRPASAPSSSSASLKANTLRFQFSHGSSWSPALIGRSPASVAQPPSSSGAEQRRRRAVNRCRHLHHFFGAAAAARTPDAASRSRHRPPC